MRVGPLEIGFQEQVSNHLQAAAVKSRWYCALEEKREENSCGCGIRETNESEPLGDASLGNQGVVKTRGVVFSWDESAACLVTEQMATGVERA